MKFLNPSISFIWEEGSIGGEPISRVFRCFKQVSGKITQAHIYTGFLVHFIDDKIKKITLKNHKKTFKVDTKVDTKINHIQKRCSRFFLNLFSKVIRNKSI